MVLFVRLGTFQRVTRQKNKRFLSPFPLAPAVSQARVFSIRLVGNGIARLLIFAKDLRHKIAEVFRVSQLRRFPMRFGDGVGTCRDTDGAGRCRQLGVLSSTARGGCRRRAAAPQSPLRGSGATQVLANLGRLLLSARRTTWNIRPSLSRF